MTRLTLVLPLLLVALAQASPTAVDTKGPVKMPSFVKRCSAKDPNINQCVILAGQDLLPKVIKGYPPLRMPSLDPLVIEEVRVETGSHRSSSLSVHGRNIVISGLASVHIKDMNIDFKNKVYVSICEIPRIEITCDYEVDGKVLLLPIKGHGKANFTFLNAIMNYTQPYKLVKKGNYVYHDLPPSHAIFNTSRVYFQLDNLFNGDKLLGEQINNFLNENWRDVVDELSGPFLEATTQVIHQFTLVIGGSVPFSEIWLDADDMVK